MFISDGKGSRIEVRPGIVDRDGIFFLMLDENDTRYFRFSDESELIIRLQDMISELARRNNRLSRDLASKDREIQELKETVGDLEIDVETLLERLNEMRCE